MTGAPPTAPLLRRLLVGTTLACAPICVGMPLLYRAMLGLDREATLYIGIGYVVGALLSVVGLGVAARYGLRGIAGAKADDELARRRVLRLPVRLAGLSLITGTSLTILLALLRLLTAPDAAVLVIGIAMTSIALATALAVPVYAVARTALEPHALFFASATLPPGRRIPLGLLTGYTVLAVAAIALLPAALFGNSRLATTRATEAAQRSRATARRIARMTATMHAPDALQLIARTQLENALIAVRLPSGHITPPELEPPSARKLGEEAPLSAELRGGTVIVIGQPPQASGVPLLLVVGVLELLVALVALALARSLARDTRAVTGQVDALAEDRDPEASHTMATSEMRKLSLAINRLLERIPRLQLEKYLAVEQAEESRRLKSMFLANMSHDLRSPLNSILGFSELLTRGLEGPITDEQRTQLDDIHATGSHLLRLLSEILETARAESGHLDLERKPTPPTTFVTQATKEALRGRPQSVSDRLEIDLQAGIQPASVDALRMQQALTHAMDWAIDVAHGSPVHVDVAERNRPRGRALVIEVWCEGQTSIEEEAQLFQPFRKVEGVPGLHLALPLSRRLVEAHGGQMEAFGGQRPGVRIILPIATTTRPPISERRRT